MKDAFDRGKLESRIKELEDDLLSKFSPDFKDKIKQHSLHHKVFMVLLNGTSPYRVLEQVIDDLIESLKYRDEKEDL